MHSLSTVSELRDYLMPYRKNGSRIVFVPTMGALHDGHLSLIRTASLYGDCVVLSIFVNPSQFSANEDFSTYPRDLERDLSLVEELGVACVFTPSPDEMYPLDDDVSFGISLPPMAQRLCGQSRPHFFGGVASVVCRLFHAVMPDVAIFGEKDFQQFRIIEDMARDLLLPIEVIAAPIVRESDGLAMSSRNQYLSADERQIAGRLYKAILLAQDKVANGEVNAEIILGAVSDLLTVDAALTIDYCQIVDSISLSAVDTINERSRLMLAVYLGSTRLIDNSLLYSPL